MDAKEMVSQIIDKFARCLVGKLCKRVELLGEGENMSLLKKITKEQVYEECRTLKSVIFFYLFKEGTTECKFFGKEREDEEKGTEGRNK